MKILLNNRHKSGLFLMTVVAGLCLILGETLRETLGVVIIGFALTWAFGSTNRVLRICIGTIGLLLFTVPFIAALIDHHNAVQGYEKSLDSFRSELPEFAKKHPDLATGLLPPLSPGATLIPPATARTPSTVPSVATPKVLPPDFNGWDGPSSNTQNEPPPGVVLGPPVTEHDPYAGIRTPVPTKTPPGVVLDFGRAQPINKILVVPNTGNIAFPVTMSDKDISKALRAYPENHRAPSWYLEALDAGVSPDWINELTPPLDKPEAFDFKHTISDGSVVEVHSVILGILFFGSVIAEAKRFISHSNKPVKS